MPTVLQVGPYSFIFFSSDRGEPAHIHVKRDRQLAKFWMNPVSLEKNRGFKEHELNQIARLVEEYEQILLEAWHDQKFLDGTRHVIYPWNQSKISNLKSSSPRIYLWGQSKI